jgi:hypothetical protein
MCALSEIRIWYWSIRRRLQAVAAIPCNSRSNPLASSVHLYWRNDESMADEPGREPGEDSCAPSVWIYLGATSLRTYDQPPCG